MGDRMCTSEWPPQALLGAESKTEEPFDSAQGEVIN